MLCSTYYLVTKPRQFSLERVGVSEPGIVSSFFREGASANEELPLLSLSLSRSPCTHVSLLSRRLQSGCQFKWGLKTALQNVAVLSVILRRTGRPVHIKAMLKYKG